MIVAERHRLHTARTTPIRDSIKAHLLFLKQQRAELDHELLDVVWSDPSSSARYDLLIAMPGVGPVLTFTLLGKLPELRHLPHKQLAALAGLAPFHQDSGTLRGHRRV